MSVISKYKVTMNMIFKYYPPIHCDFAVQIAVDVFCELTYQWDSVKSTKKNVDFNDNNT